MSAPPVRTVAVIDDDRRVLTSLANLLASGGYGTRAYESALDFFADGYSGLVCVITDLGMRPLTAFRCSIERFIRMQSRRSALSQGDRAGIRKTTICSEAH